MDVDGVGASYLDEIEGITPYLRDFLYDQASDSEDSESGKLN